MNVKDWGKYNYFKSFEFDSPDRKGSGRAMKEEFILKLNEAREIAGIEGRKLGLQITFDINSGLRTPEHNKKVGGKSNSSHLRGWAADLRINNNFERRIILNSLIKVGLNRRIGIAETFIHVDDDPKKNPSYWTYSNRMKGVVSFIKNIFTNNQPEDL